MSIERWPILYKKTTKKTIKFWNIYVIDDEVRVNWGVIGGSALETAEVVKNEPDEITKIDRTTARYKAVAIARERYRKQLKLGYTMAIDKAAR